MHEVNLFKTSDFLTAAYLLAQSQKIHSVNRFGKRVEFCFLKKNKCELLNKQLILGEDLVSANSLYISMKAAKRIIYDGL
jgi:hypothetical protein